MSDVTQHRGDGAGASAASGTGRGSAGQIDRLLYAVALGEGVGKLRFSPPIETEFRDEYVQHSLARTRTGFLLAIGLYLAFLTIRVLTETGPAASLGLMLRSMIIATMIAAVLASYQLGRVPLTGVVVATYWVFAGGITAIECIAEYYQIDRRYEGLIFITFHCYVFTLLLFRTACLTAFSIFLIYAVGGWLGGLHIRALGYDLFFLALINVLGGVALYSRECAERENFLRRKILQQMTPSRSASSP